MKSVENKRRELFEDWYESLNHYTPMKNIYGNLWGYYEPKVQDAWSVWNAALDSVVIEVPPYHELHEMTSGDLYDAVLVSIESTNLGLKVK